MGLRNMFIILRREYYQRVKKKTFIIITLLTPILLILLMAAPAGVAYLTKDSVTEVTKVAVFDNSYKVAQQLVSSERVIYDTIEPSGEEQVKAGEDYDAYLYINEDVVDNHKNILFESHKEINMRTQKEVEQSLNRAIKKLKIAKYDDIKNLPDIVADLDVYCTLQTMEITETGEKIESSSFINYIIGFLGGFLIYFFIFIYGSMVLNSIVDEKSSKVVEVMVSTVPPTQMMMGKILGIGLVAITQFFIWAIVVLAGGAALVAAFSEQIASPETMQLMSSGAMVPMDNMMPSEVNVVLNGMSDILGILKVLSLFILFFIGGYLFYAACFAAIASAVDNIQDVSQLQTPITIPIIISMVFLTAVIEEPNGPIAFWLSVIPFTAPVIMMGRISSSIPVWEIVLSLGVLYASFVGMIWVAGRIYRVGIFMHGKKPTFKDLYKWIKYK